MKNPASHLVRLVEISKHIWIIWWVNYYLAINILNLHWTGGSQVLTRASNSLYHAWFGYKRGSIRNYFLFTRFVFPVLSSKSYIIVNLVSSSCSFKHTLCFRFTSLYPIHSSILSLPLVSNHTSCFRFCFPTSQLYLYLLFTFHLF